MIMSCGKARRILWGDAGPHVVTDARLAAEAHREECAECRRFFRDMHDIQARVGTDAPPPAAPLAARDRLFQAVAQARLGTHRRTRRSRGALAAGLLVLAAAGAWWFIRPAATSPQAVAELVVTDHQRAATAGGINSGDTATAARWLEEQLAFAVHIPAFPGGELLGARVAMLDGREAAVILYRVDGRPVSYYVSPLPRARSAPGRLTPPVPARWAGYPVVTWEDPGLLHALVGNLPDARLVELAHICMQQMGMTVALSIL